MATLVDLRKRLRGIQTICQLAGAMRSVSSAKLARLNSAIYAFTPYAEGCRELQAASGAVISAVPDAEERTLAVLLSGNRGLCGSYHNELFSYFHSLSLSGDVWFITGGNKAAAHLKERGIPILEEMSVSDVPEYPEADALTERILSLYQSGKVNRVIFIYSEAVNAMNQKPRCLELLPGEGSAQSQDILWLPDPSTVREGLAEFCLRAQVYYLLLRCAMGVQGATLSSMRSAYDNGMDSAAELEREINRLRQTKVTASVIETSSGLWMEGEG
jgi:F-type H+-transporting ATPase subunit gamma